MRTRRIDRLVVLFALCVVVAVAGVFYTVKAMAGHRDPVAPVVGDAQSVNDGSKKQGRDVKMVKARRHSKADENELVGVAGGCLEGYGKGKACLPPPSSNQLRSQPWTCSEVRVFLSDGIALNRKGVDPARLDTNGDGVACGVGD